MPKLVSTYTDQINFLTITGTGDMLRAISYYRGSRGRLADPARDFIDAGIRNFVDGLDKKERARFEDILSNVKITSEGHHSSEV